MFDSLLRTVPFDGREQSFHPKVLIARQCSENQADRYILAVGSRNLTGSNAWDLGVGLVGYARPSTAPGFRRIEGVDAFVKDIAQLVGDSKLPASIGRLELVSWQLPPSATGVSFHYHAGMRRTFAQTQIGQMPKAARVLLISPFLTSALLRDVINHFRDAENISLVSGKSALDQVAATQIRKSLEDNVQRIKLFSMSVASDDPGPDDLTEREGVESLGDGRGLHAKVICVETGKGALAIVGSANLTSHAWTGQNWEAFLVLRGMTDLADELREWLKLRAAPYRLADAPNIGEPFDPVDALRNELATKTLLLEDFPGAPSHLTGSGVTAALQKYKCHLEVSRFTAPTAWTSWSKSSDEISLPQCAPSERTSFVNMKATSGAVSQSWIQCVSVIPAISSERDHEAFVRLLGFGEFLRYLRALSDESETDISDSSTEGDKSRGGSAGSALTNVLQLEHMLRQLNRDPLSLEELKSTISRYLALFERSIDDSAEKARLREFLSLWEALVQGMEMQWT